MSRAAASRSREQEAVGASLQARLTYRVAGSIDCQLTSASALFRRLMAGVPSTVPAVVTGVGSIVVTTAPVGWATISLASRSRGSSVLRLEADVVTFVPAGSGAVRFLHVDVQPHWKL